jgi:hypothetical protein
MYVLWLRDRHSLAVWIVAAVLILFSLYTLGSLLDGEARALRHETWRLVAWISGGGVDGAGPGPGNGRMGAAGFRLVQCRLGAGAMACGGAADILTARAPPSHNVTRT